MHEIVSWADINGIKFAACGEYDPVAFCIAVTHSKSRLLNVTPNDSATKTNLLALLLLQRPTIPITRKH
jgi:hypothetical protein